MLTRGGRFRQVASRIHVTSSRLTSSHNQLADSNDTPFKLKLIVPPSAEPQEITFTDNTALYDFVKSYQGSLRATGPNGQPCIIIGPTKYKQLLPTEIYSVHSPFFNATSDERQHSQVADRAFEDKARLAMMNYLSSAEISYNELSRTIKVGDREVAE
jgi:hypothetical protein